MMAWNGNGWQTPYMPPVDPRYAYAPPGYTHTPPSWLSPDLYPAPTPAPPQQMAHPGVSTHAQSIKYPKLNPALAEDTTLVRFDIRLPPKKSIIPQAFHSATFQYAFATHVKHMRLISKAFPWALDIKTEDGNITCDDVWKGLYMGLQQPIADSEWWFIIRDKGHVDKIEKAAKRRLQGNPKADKRPLRIDYLGDATLFRGLEQDGEFSKARQVPLSAKCDETWVVRLSE